MTKRATLKAACRQEPACLQAAFRVALFMTGCDLDLEVNVSKTADLAMNAA